MYLENRQRLKQEMVRTGAYVDKHVIILKNSFTSPKYDDDCDYFPTKMEPYLTWLTGVFYEDINFIVHLDTLELTAFYPEPSLEERNFIKYYSLEELQPFGVTKLIYENEIVSFLKKKDLAGIHLIYGILRFLAYLKI